MLTLRGVYDGQHFRVLSGQPKPLVNREVPVAIVFLEDVPGNGQDRQRQAEIATRMRAARAKMSPLGISVKDLVEAGRER